MAENQIPNDKEFLEALAALLKNTKTKKRQISLIEFSGFLKAAIEKLGSIEDVAERIGLSAKMLKQFLSVDELSSTVQEYFANRRLDSVDMASHLKLLKDNEQKVVAKAALDGELSTADIRAIREFRKENPDYPIRDVIEKVKSTRNIKQYVVEFVIRGRKISKKTLTKHFESIIGDDNIVSIELRGVIGKIVTNQTGKYRLQHFARERNISLTDAVSCIVRGEV